MDWLYESLCLCGSAVEEAPQVEVDEFMMVSLTRAVEDFDAWFETFERAQDEMRRLGVTKSFVGRYETVEGRFVFKKVEAHAHVVHVFRRESYDYVRDALKDPPYSGAADVVFSNVVSEFDYGDLDAADALVSLHHGVPDFPEFLLAYAARERAGKLADLETTKTLVGEVQPGCAGVHLVHLLPEGAVENLALDFGGDPDLEAQIKAGDILRPYGSLSSALVLKRDS